MTELPMNIVDESRIPTWVWNGSATLRWCAVTIAFEAVISYEAW